MSEKKKLSELALLVAPESAEALTDVLIREVEEDEYLSHEQFKDSEHPCFDRGVAILKEAGISITPKKAMVMQYVIAKHRLESHNENTEPEVRMAIDALGPQEVSTYKSVWWKG